MAKDSSPRSFFRESQQAEVAGLEDSAPPTAPFDEADALFGRRTEPSDSGPAKAPDPEPQSEDADFVPHEPAPAGPIPVPYPNTGSPGEKEEESEQPAFGSGASNHEPEPASFSPTGETSPGADPFEDFHDPAGASLDDPFETDDPHDVAVVAEDAGVELGIEDSPEDLAIDPG